MTTIKPNEDKKLTLSEIADLDAGERLMQMMDKTEQDRLNTSMPKGLTALVSSAMGSSMEGIRQAEKRLRTSVAYDEIHEHLDRIEEIKLDWQSLSDKLEALKAREDGKVMELKMLDDGKESISDDGTVTMVNTNDVRGTMLVARLCDIMDGMQKHNATITKTCDDIVALEEGIEAHKELCHERFRPFETEVRETARQSYRDLRSYDIKTEEVAHRSEERLTINALYGEYYDTYVTDPEFFAQAMATRAEVTKVALREMLHQHFLLMEANEEMGNGWIVEKWRSRMENIDEFLEACMRLCSKKLSSWARAVAIVWNYLKDHMFTRGTTSEWAWYVTYMKRRFPEWKATMTADVKTKTLLNNRTISEEDRETYYHHFDTLAFMADVAA